MSEQKPKSPQSFWALYGKYIVIIAAALILIILIVILAGVLTKKSSSPAETESGSVISLIPESQSGNTGDSLMGLKVDAYPEINTLVQKYFDAKKNCDAEALNNIVDYETDKTAEDLELENQFVEDYQDIKCYTAPGLDSGSYVVYVYYRIKFASIDTTAPSLIRLYLCTNSDQTLYIYGKTPSGELKSFIDEMDSSEDVRILIATVNNELKEACEQDEALAKLQEMLKNGSGAAATADDFEVTSEESDTISDSSGTEEVSSASETETAEAETETAAASASSESTEE